MMPIHEIRTAYTSVLCARLMLVSTVLCAAIFSYVTINKYLDQQIYTKISLVDTFLYLACGGALIFSAAAHLLGRLGYLLRLRSGRVPAAPGRPSEAAVAILIPSYREEPDVVHRTLLSAALQSHRNKRISLLLDDPPKPTAAADRTLLAAGRAAPDRVAAFFAPLGALARRAAETADPVGALRDLHAQCAAHFYATAAGWPARNHEDRLFASVVLEHRARVHAARAETLRGTKIAAADAVEEIRRITQDCHPDVVVFERKRFANLSQAPNKAMNLNTYIGLIGGSFRTVAGPDGLHLVAADAGAGLAVPQAEFVVTLDADSLLAPVYVETLVGIMEAETGSRLAVVQTPYAATPDAPGRLERAAGATTDVQRLLHQGYTRFESTFWVGANAVLRLAALEDIRETFEERGHAMQRFIQDRTVIEDTESTIDLARKGWTLWNHPEILAYSATPPDFGSLVIQRRRWACGGLLILPKAMALLLQRGIGHRIAQSVIRLHYLGSLAWVPAAVILLLAYPFPQPLDTWWLPLAAAPYFVAYAWDLRLTGRSTAEIATIYGLNLLLVPVHASGAIASLRQAVTGRHIPFQRTPKVEGRTATPWTMLIAIWIAPAFLLFGAMNDILGGAYMRATMASGNGILMAAAAVYFVGIRGSLEDLSSLGESWMAKIPNLRQSTPTTP